MNDTNRLNYLLKFIRIDDVGDVEYCKGVVVDNEALEEQLGFGPVINGRMECTVKEWDDDLRDVIDRAMVAHGFAKATRKTTTRAPGSSPAVCWPWRCSRCGRLNPYRSTACLCGVKT